MVIQLLFFLFQEATDKVVHKLFWRMFLSPVSSIEKNIHFFFHIIQTVDLFPKMDVYFPLISKWPYNNLILFMCKWNQILLFTSFYRVYMRSDSFIHVHISISAVEYVRKSLSVNVKKDVIKLVQVMSVFSLGVLV